MHLHNICATALKQFPDRIAVRSGDTTLTYRELTNRAERLAQHWLAQGFRNGERVALWLPNCPEALISYLACFRAGLIAVALDFRYQPDEAAYCLQTCAAAGLVVQRQKWETFRARHPDVSLRDIRCVGDNLPFDRQLETGDAPDPHRDDDDYLSTIFFTSGTTQRPKGVTHTSRRTVSRIEKFSEEIALNQDSVSLVAISLMKPLAFQLLAMALFRAGGTVTLAPQFSAETFWQLYLAPPQKTLLALTPNLLAEVLPHPLAARAQDHPPAIWLIGGDRLPAPLHVAFQQRVPGELIEVCGMTETGPYAMNPPFKPKRIGSVGVAPMGVLLRIVDNEENDVVTGEIGQVVVRTPDTMIGYWNDTLATYQVLRDGWMRTGDLARADQDGYLWLEGRLKEMIVRDGSNIAPVEIENVALAQPGIEAAAAVGTPDPPHGEAVHLFVAGSSPHPDQTVRDVADRLRQQLRPLAMPARIHWLAALPRNAGGKIDRAQLRRVAAQPTPP